MTGACHAQKRDLVSKGRLKHGQIQLEMPIVGAIQEVTATPPTILDKSYDLTNSI